MIVWILSITWYQFSFCTHFMGQCIKGVKPNNIGNQGDQYKFEHCKMTVQLHSLVDTDWCICVNQWELVQWSCTVMSAILDSFLLVCSFSPLFQNKGGTSTACYRKDHFSHPGLNFKVPTGCILSVGTVPTFNLSQFKKQNGHPLTSNYFTPFCLPTWQC